ncbi:SDR family oxidoreductase [Pseudovibrio sp. WM33]|uniref:SDR family oxidoreductase n=1 Tax=Pseudovibrio sp. WM33 TaxID=1735585 RepID=UPI0007AEBB68|nr:SDR family NAD(P)-dependent oxidoreductase [Pseudovibrio sp. WM33]KZL28598.1 3-oxoacyl-[acyl-carrier-protein] reductase FabG [Pseudovibrio sp. WM33]
MTQAQKKVVLITGAGRGLGHATAVAFMAAGNEVIATARDTSEKQDKVGLNWKSLDVKDAAACNEIIADAFAEYGRLDILINNASGYTGGMPFDELSDDEIIAETDITLKAPMLLSKAFMKHGKHQGFGKIIFIGSTAGLTNRGATSTWAAYSATKAAILRFSESLQGDLYAYGMQSHVIIPDNLRETEDMTELFQEAATSYEAVSEALLFLAQLKGNLSISRMDIRPAIIASNDASNKSETL